jgi:hypothetical protein
VEECTGMEGLPVRTRVTVDAERPSPARVYDWLLGGSHNFAVDRELAARAVSIMPQIPRVARANRHFLRRAVATVADLGVDQFLDLGSGIPTVGNVHEVAREAQPEARVVYVDVDPVAVAHSRAIIGDDPHSHVVQADLLDARDVLDDPGVLGLLDLTRPVCVLLVSVGHFIVDTFRLTMALTAYRDAVPSGSYLVMSHGTCEAGPGPITDIAELYIRSGTHVVGRDRAQLSPLLHGWEPIEPGLVYTPEWRPAPDEPPADPSEHALLAVVARKP